MLLRDGHATPPPIRRGRGSHVGAGAGRGAKPKDEATLLELATISQERGACYEAETWLTPLLETPSSPAKGAQASALVGRCLLAQERPQTAIPYFERAVRDDATSVSYWLLLGQAHRAAGQIDAAIDAYEQVLVLKPDNAAAQKALDELQGIARELQVRSPIHRSPGPLNQND